MIDPVSAELELRARLSLPWKPALAAAVALHALAVIALLLAPARRSRPLLFPSVLVRFVAPAALVHPHPPSATVATQHATAPAPPAARSAPRRALAPAKPAQPKAAAEKIVASAGPTAAVAANTPAASTGAATGPALTSHGIGVDAGTSNNGEAFPFSYYLERVLVAIEQSWFKPPVAPETRCRVLCRVDRSGRLVEAGIEEASAVPAFDRAALRAVYAASPFPPLPQAYTGTVLTLHLEFGP
jgi:TonB family protein